MNITFQIALIVLLSSIKDCDIIPAWFTFVFLKKVHDGWVDRQRETWEVTVKVQPLANFNIHPSIPVSQFHEFSDGENKGREPNRWEAAQKPLN